MSYSFNVEYSYMTLDFPSRRDIPGKLPPDVVLVDVWRGANDSILSVPRSADGYTDFFLDTYSNWDEFRARYNALYEDQNATVLQDLLSKPRHVLYGTSPVWNESCTARLYSGAEICRTSSSLSAVQVQRCRNARIACVSESWPDVDAFGLYTD